MRCPTSEECNDNTQVEAVNGVRAFAAWYSQMGGYWGKCILVDLGNSCFDVHVWHDGEWPFNDLRAL